MKQYIFCGLVMFLVGCVDSNTVKDSKSSSLETTQTAITHNSHSGSNATSMYSGLEVRAPDIAENGLVIPLEVKVDSPVASGDSLEIFANGILVSSIQPTGDFQFNKYSTRTRMIKPGIITAIVYRKNGTSQDAIKYVDVKNASGYPEPNEVDSLKRPKELGGLRISSKATGFKMIYAGYAPKILLKSQNGGAIIENTPMMTYKTPFIGVYGDYDYSSVKAEILDYAPVFLGANKEYKTYGISDNSAKTSGADKSQPSKKCKYSSAGQSAFGLITSFANALAGSKEGVARGVGDMIEGRMRSDDCE